MCRRKLASLSGESIGGPVGWIALTEHRVYFQSDSQNTIHVLTDGHCNRDQYGDPHGCEYRDTTARPLGNFDEL